MRTLHLVSVLVCVGVFVVGCGKSGLEAYDRFELGSARDVVGTCVESMGGLAAWRDVDEIKATALVTNYGPAGTAHVDRVNLSIDHRLGRITACGRSRKGPWRVTTRDDGSFKVSGAEAESAARIAPWLPLLLHRIRGPLNLLGPDEKAHGIRRMRAGGFNVIRVGVTGRPNLAAAYYFDEVTCQLRYVTGRGGGKGEFVTTYNYMFLPNGMAFPKEIRMVKTGQHVLIGKQPLLEVEFSDVDIR